MKSTYAYRNGSDALRDAVGYVLAARTLTGSRKRETHALERRRWSLAEIDAIRLAAISRRQALTHRNT